MNIPFTSGIIIHSILKIHQSYVYHEYPIDKWNHHDFPPKNFPGKNPRTHLRRSSSSRCRRITRLARAGAAAARGAAAALPTHLQARQEEPGMGKMMDNVASVNSDLKGFNGDLLGI